MSVGLPSDAQDKRCWQDFPNFAEAEKAGAIILRQDVKLLDNIVKMGVDTVFDGPQQLSRPMKRREPVKMQQPHARGFDAMQWYLMIFRMATRGVNARQQPAAGADKAFAVRMAEHP